MVAVAALTFLPVACSSSSFDVDPETLATSGCGGNALRIEAPSTAMEPTIATRSEVSVCPLGEASDLERRDIVYFERLDTDPVSTVFPTDIFRVIALAGETVAITQDGLLVNGQALAGTRGITASAEGPARCLVTANGCTLDAGEVFVVGDNFDASIDSRSFGPLPIDHIIGTVEPS